jgi:ribosomal protein L11 methyltransferase
VLVGVLSQTGFEGFWDDDPFLRCYMKMERWSDSLHQETERVIRLVARAGSTPAPQISVRFTADQNWNEEWEKTIRPIRVTDSMVITPSWHSVPDTPGQLIVVIDPKMSFGTGYHETTRLSLRLLASLLRPSMRVLDVGTGTGILAIAAVKLGASSVTGIDIDEWAYTNALENVERNGVAGRVQILQTPLPSIADSGFDLIVANIQLDVIAELLVEMTARLAGDGSLVLSGLFLADKPALEELLDRNGLHITEELSENEWVAVAARRKQL